MDVSGWTIDQRLRFPDWCFGDRELVMLSLGVWVAGGFFWVITGVDLPEHICIWQMGVVVRRNDSADNYFRLGLAATVPLNVADMDASIPLFPQWGNIAFAPPRITLPEETDQTWFFNTRNGIHSQGLRFVGEIWGNACPAMVQINIVYSCLPTNMIGWMDHSRV